MSRKSKFETQVEKGLAHMLADPKLSLFFMVGWLEAGYPDLSKKLEQAIEQDRKTQQPVAESYDHSANRSYS